MLLQSLSTDIPVGKGAQGEAEPATTWTQEVEQRIRPWMAVIRTMQELLSREQLSRWQSTSLVTFLWFSKQEMHSTQPKLHIKFLILNIKKAVS